MNNNIFTIIIIVVRLQFIQSVWPDSRKSEMEVIVKREMKNSIEELSKEMWEEEEHWNGVKELINRKEKSEFIFAFFLQQIVVVIFYCIL